MRLVTGGARYAENHDDHRTHLAHLCGLGKCRRASSRRSQPDATRGSPLGEVAPDASSTPARLASIDSPRFSPLDVPGASAAGDAENASPVHAPRSAPIHPPGETPINASRSSAGDSSQSYDAAVDAPSSSADADASLDAAGSPADAHAPNEPALHSAFDASGSSPAFDSRRQSLNSDTQQPFQRLAFHGIEDEQPRNLLFSSRPQHPHNSTQQHAVESLFDLRSQLQLRTRRESQSHDPTSR
jgi:hypothetical protein